MVYAVFSTVSCRISSDCLFTVAVEEWTVDFRDLSCREGVAQNIENGPFSQVLEVSNAYFMDFSGFDGAEDDAMDTTPIRNEATQQFQKGILALQVTSLKVHDTDFMDVDGDP